MLRAGQIIILCAVALLTLGVVMVNSAGMTVDPVRAAPDGTVLTPDQPRGVTFKSIIFSRSSLYMALALIALAAGSFVPVRRLADRLASSGAGTSRSGFPADAGLLALATAALLAVLATVYIPGVGREVNGSSRWIALPFADGLSLQPSEFAKWGLLALAAWWAARRGPDLSRFWIGLVPALIAIGAPAALVTAEDLGTGVLIAAAACLVLLAGGARLWHFLLFVPPGLAAVGLAILASPYRVARLTAFLDPYADPQGTGYHMIQSMAAVAGGGLFGRGLGHGLQKFGYLPEDRTDFLFAIICEELGTPGAALVISLFIGILLAGLAITRREPHPLLRLLSFGVIATVGLQAVINLAVVTGLGPTKGIALPLVSSGGTGWILTAFSLGLLNAIDRHTPRRPAQHHTDAPATHLPPPAPA
jgi:cell division protein FtsW